MLQTATFPPGAEGWPSPGNSGKLRVYTTVKGGCHATPGRRLRHSQLLSSRAVSGGRGYPSETQVRRGTRIVHGDKELLEKLGRNDLCPCGSGHRFQELLPAHRTPRW